MFPFFCNLFLFYLATSYNNGVGEKPLMGWSPCYTLNWMTTEESVKNQTMALINSGLHSLGYEYINIDTGWILNRTENGTLMYDPTKFPNGMKSLGDWIHSKGLKYGLYSSRGTIQCGSKPPRNYSAPGSYGYYQQDAQYMANVGADYFKLDSCGAVGNIYDAFNQYQEFGMYLNKTGRPIYYDLCNGWYYALYGYNYSNSWRIAGDDGSWEREIDIAKVFWIFQSGMWKFARPFGWNNMDFLFSTNANSNYITGKQTSIQARTQFSIYAIGSSDLVLSNDITNLTQFDLETYSNKEVIAVNQNRGIQFGNIFVHAGFKIKGISPQNWVVYGKMMHDKSFVAVFMNANNKSIDIICDESCFLSMGFNK
eukprot:80519_1